MTWCPGGERICGQHDDERSRSNLPHNADVEASLLWAMLTGKSPPVAEPACAEVRPDDFYVLTNQCVASAIDALVQRGHPVDEVLVAEELRASGLCEDADASVRDLMTTTTWSTSNWRQYAAKVKELAFYRSVIASAARSPLGPTGSGWTAWPMP